MNQLHADNQTKGKPVIGLLGGPGSGKSAVARLFAGLGCGVIDADALAHEAIQSEAARQQLREWWGDGVIDEAGRVDRAKVGQIVFHDKPQLKRLEALVHPIVHRGREAARRRYRQDPAVVAIVEDCPLLLESGLGSSCDALVFVDCPEAVRLERLKATRGWDADDLKKREQHQIPLDTKRERADYVMNNNAPLDDVRESARGVLQKILTA